MYLVLYAFSILGLKKDPGIPNKFPLKEQTLKQIQEAKEREIAKRQKEARMRQLTKRRSLDSLRADAEKRQSKFEKKVSGDINIHTCTCMS